MYRLIATHGEEERVFAIPDGEVRLGAASDNELVLSVRGVSRHHAIVRRCLGGVEIVDLGSTNGLYVGGRATESAVLTPGLRVQVGEVWLELEEVSSSGEALALMLESSPSGRPSRTAPTVTVEPDPSGEVPPSADAALALARHIEQLRVAFPLRQDDLLARIRTTLGAEAFLCFERRRGKLLIWQKEGDLPLEEKRHLASLAKSARSTHPDEVVLKRSSQFLIAGRDPWFLGAKFASESFARESWRKDFLRFLAHRFFMPVEALAELKSAEARRALAIQGDNKKQTAKLLGISRNTLDTLLGRRGTAKRKP